MYVYVVVKGEENNKNAKIREVYQFGDVRVKKIHWKITKRLIQYYEIFIFRVGLFSLQKFRRVYDNSAK